MKSSHTVKLILTLALLPLALLQSGCIGDDCGRTPTYLPEEAVFVLDFIVPNTLDQDQYLDVQRYPCFRDSVMVYQENGQPALDFNFRQNGTIFFAVNNFRDDHSAAFRAEVRKRFQLYINYREIHYIEFRYMLRDTGCGYSLFDYVEAYYDDVLMYQLEDVPELKGLFLREEMDFYQPC